jgi:hypothetical protein
MKLPAVAIAAAFAGGILLGLYLSLHKVDSLRDFVLVMLAVAVGACVVSAILLRYNLLWGAGIVSLRPEYGQGSFLLPGDAEKQVEYTMLSENDAGLLHADVLKVGHHGSNDSTMPQFLAADDPQIAVISSGEENPYGHPSPELLQRLEQSGARILRTDRDGTVQVLTNGQDLRVNCYLACVESPVESGAAQPPNHHQSN